jgi:hypothetical protein
MWLDFFCLEEFFLKYYNFYLDSHVRDTRIEKNTTILSNRSKILQKRNKHSDYHIMIKILLHYNNSIVSGKNII